MLTQDLKPQRAHIMSFARANKVLEQGFTTPTGNPPRGNGEGKSMRSSENNTGTQPRSCKLSGHDAPDESRRFFPPLLHLARNQPTGGSRIFSFDPQGGLNAC